MTITVNPSGLGALDAAVAAELAERGGALGPAACPASRGEAACPAVPAAHSSLGVEHALAQGREFFAEQVPAKYPQHVQTCSLGESTFNLVNMLVGSGTLNVPFAFKLSGYWSSMVLIVTLGANYYTALLVGRASDVASERREPGPEEARDFSFIADVAFGRRGSFFVRLMTGLEMWLSVVLITLFIGNLLSDLQIGVPMNVSIFASMVLSTLMGRISLRVFAYVSLSSLFVLLAAAAAYGTYTLTLPVWACPGFADAPRSAALDVPKSVGVLMFCFSGHPCLPEVRNAMREPRRYPKAVSVSFTFAFAYYLIVGLVGYLSMGDGLQVVMTQGLDKRSVCYWALTVLFLAKCQFQVPVFLRTIISGCGLQPGGSAFVLGVEVAVATVTALTACLFADKIDAIASLCGNFLTMGCSIVFPVVAYWTLERQEGRALALLPKVVCLNCLAFGCLSGTLGTCEAVREIFSDKLPTAVAEGISS